MLECLQINMSTAEEVRYIYEIPRTRQGTFQQYLDAIESSAYERRLAFTQFDRATCRLINDLPANNELFLDTPIRASEKYAKLCSDRAAILQNSIQQSNPNRFDKDFLTVTANGVLHTLDTIIEAHEGPEEDLELESVKRMRAWWQIRADVADLLEFEISRHPSHPDTELQRIFPDAGVRMEW